MARKLAQDQERIDVLPSNQRGHRAGKAPCENAARFAYDFYERIQRKEQTLTTAINLEDAYNRVQFKLLMELLVQYGGSLMLTRRLAAALQERKVTMWLGNWISMPKQLTMGLPQAYPLFPVRYYVYTKGLVDLDSNGLNMLLTLVDDGPENLGTYCCEWPAGKANAECKSLLKPIPNHVTPWSTWTAQSQGTGLLGDSQASRVEGL